MNAENLTITKSREHFKILDGLRGVAAFGVLIFHYAEWIIADFSKNLIAHGFLAVDFFFCLSGFVVAYAYDNRLAGMGSLEFFKRRLIRLHPLVGLGAFLGLIAFFIDPFSNAASLYTAGNTIVVFLCSFFLIPYPVMEYRSFNNFGLNAPSWSLFWEYIANIAYAIVLYRLNKKGALVLGVLALGILCYVSYTAGNIIGGWNGETFWHGGARIFFSFMAGLLIYRYNWIIKNKIGFAGLSALLFLAFLLPFNDDFNWITELFVVVIYFPLLVSLGAGSTLSPKLEKACDFAGNISYPLYMTHYAGIWIFGNYFLTTNPGSTELTIVIISGCILMILFAYLIMRFYDIPLRRYLTKKYVK